MLKNPIIAWQENDHRDEIHYIIFKLKRRFIAWNEGVGYDLVIGTIKEKESFVSWRIHQTNDQNIARITIDIYPYIMNMGNKLMQWIPFELYIRPQLSSYLNSVLGGLTGISKIINPHQKITSEHIGGFLKQRTNNEKSLYPIGSSWNRITHWAMFASIIVDQYTVRNFFQLV